VYLSLNGRLTKKSGYARLTSGKAAAVERLVYDDARILRLMRADSAEVLAFTRERFNDAPDWFVGGPLLRDPRQISAFNAFQSSYAWGKSEVVDFTSATERPLQAALYYPANYDPSRKYPMIVYTYELLSQNVHQYPVPSERSYYNTAVWTANGYFVLQPDIVFRGRDPGISVLDAVVPAVKTIIAAWTRGLGARRARGPFMGRIRGRVPSYEDTHLCRFGRRRSDHELPELSGRHSLDARHCRDGSLGDGPGAHGRPVLGRHGRLPAQLTRGKGERLAHARS
jgi:hypothetical protein